MEPTVVRRAPQLRLVSVLAHPSQPEQGQREDFSQKAQGILGAHSSLPMQTFGSLVGCMPVPFTWVACIGMWWVPWPLASRLAKGLSNLPSRFLTRVTQNSTGFLEIDFDILQFSLKRDLTIKYSLAF